MCQGSQQLQGALKRRSAVIDRGPTSSLTCLTCLLVLRGVAHLTKLTNMLAVVLFTAAAAAPVAPGDFGALLPVLLFAGRRRTGTGGNRRGATCMGEACTTHTQCAARYALHKISSRLTSESALSRGLRGPEAPTGSPPRLLLSFWLRLA